MNPLSSSPPLSLIFIARDALLSSIDAMRPEGARDDAPNPPNEGDGDDLAVDDDDNRREYEGVPGKFRVSLG